MKTKSFLKKFLKPLRYFAFAVLFVVLAFLANISDGLTEIPLGVEANKFVIVEGVKLPEVSYKVPLPFFKEGRYEVLIINRKGQSIQYLGELADGRWIQSEDWINLQLPALASIYQIEVRDQKVVVYFGRNNVIVLFAFVLAAFNLFFGFGLLSSETSINFKVQRE